MKSFFEKIIAIFLVFELLSSIGLFIILLKPEKAQAAAITGDFMIQIKEYVLDAVGNIISNLVIKRLEQNIYDWGQGRKSASQIASGIGDFKEYFDEFINIASAKFLNDLKDTPLCTGIAKSFGTAPTSVLGQIRTAIGTGRFAATFSRYYQDRPTYQQYGACTLDRVIQNVESFIKRPRISIYGFDAWKALTTRNNNVFGAFFTALDYKTQIEIQETANAANKAAVSGGYRNQESTTANTQDKCRLTCEAGTGLATCTGERIGSDYGPCTSTDQCNSGQTCTNGVCTDTSATTIDEQRCQQDIAVCVENCVRIPFLPLATAVSNLGSSIHESMDKALGADLQRVINVQEITQLAGIFFQALFNKAINGLGLAYNASKATQVQQSRSGIKDNYGYLRQFGKSTTAQSIKDVRAGILASLDQSIKQFDRSIIACKDDQMMTYQDWGKNIADILQSNVEGLYVGITGVSVQPDAVTLDPPYAPYSVYGYSWGEVFPTKVPEKCRAILTKLSMSNNSTCADVISGLEPKYNLAQTATPQCSDGKDNDADGIIDYPADSGCYSALDNSETGREGSGGADRVDCVLRPYDPACMRIPQAMDIIPGIGDSPCIPCMYDHDALNCTPNPRPPQHYPGEGATVWTAAVLAQKQTTYDKCGGNYTTTLKRCDECLKKYDESCAMLTSPAEQSNCIMESCNNYADIADLVIDPPNNGLDFYGKCLIEEQKNACFTCLKEYYIPATYCEQLRDYVGRLVIKYPAIVVNKYADNEGEFRGLFDQSIADKGGLCDDNDGKENISLALICRALPDFMYNGEKVCRTRCLNRAGSTLTEQQLLDVSDFRPDEYDCNKQQLDVGGKMPFKTIEDGVLDARGKCCADFWQKDPRNYTACVGAGPTTDIPSTPGSTFSCTLTAEPSSGLAPLNNVDLIANVTLATETPVNITYSFECENDGVIDTAINSTQTTATAVDACNYASNNTTNTARLTAMTANGLSATCTTTVQTTDCDITAAINPAIGLPANVNITGTLHNNNSGPFMFIFYCNVPTTGGDPSTWSGATVEHSSATNQLTLDNACTYNSPVSTAVGVTIRTGTTISSCYKPITISALPQITCTAGPTPAGWSFVHVVATPDQTFINLIGTNSGITYEYDCNNDGVYEVERTNNGYQDTNTACLTYFNTSAPSYKVVVRVSANSPSGISASTTCPAYITPPSGSTLP